MEQQIILVPSGPAPAGRVFGLRPVGPGRRELRYIAQVGALESALAAADLVERGSGRRLDRMERKLSALREATVAMEQKEHRLILALGALQRETEILREKLALAERAKPALPARLAGTRASREPRAPKRSWIATIFRRA